MCSPSAVASSQIAKSADVEAGIAAAERSRVGRHPPRRAMHRLDQNLILAVLRVGEIVLDDLVDEVVGQCAHEVALPVVA